MRLDHLLSKEKCNTEVLRTPVSKGKFGKHCSILKVLEDFKEKLEKKEEPETLAVKC